MRNTGPNRATMRKLWDRADGACELCGRVIRDYGFSRHHRRPRGMGGSRRDDTNSLPNLLLVCGSATSAGGCHARVESDREEAMRNGWLLRQGVEPHRIPVHLIVGWVWLTKDGNYAKATPPDEEVAA